jgi:hypothetical protein
MMIKDDRPAVGFATRQNGARSSWTLTTILGEFLAEVEQRYGQRDISFTLLGVEFGENGPRIWFPGDRRHVAIRLSESARRDPTKATWELAHEVCHAVLGPCLVEQALVIEEGLAASYQMEMGERHGLDWHLGDPGYEEARVLAERLLADHGADIVKRLRVTRPRMADWDSRFMIEHGISSDLALKLAEPFEQPHSALALGLKRAPLAT